MRRKVFLRKAIKRVWLAGTAVGAAFALHACTDVEAQPRPDPAEVQRFLDQLEATGGFASGEAQRKDGSARSIRRLVEGAAVRAPSTPTINRLETVVASRLS